MKAKLFSKHSELGLFTNQVIYQRGAALIVSLIILLVLTVIGVGSMQSLVLEERMVYNSRQSMVAAQQAEAALRAGELWLATDGNVTSNNLNQFWNGNVVGLFSERSEGGELANPFPVADRTLAATWTAANSIPVNMQGVDPAGPKTNLVGRNPRFMIEYIGRISTQQEGAQLDPNANTAYDNRDYGFRITAIGFGEDINATFVVQSTFTKTL